MAFEYKVTVKNSDSRYQLNSKSGQYEFKTIDYVDTYEDLPAALLGFLEWATDSELDNRLTLTVTPEKKSKKGDK